MSDLSKQALKVENNTSFPNNNAGLITPTNLRTFNENMIDSTVNQAGYTEDSASFNQRINEATASLATVTWDEVTEKPTVVSGSSQIDYPLISNIPSGIVSSSEQLPSGVVSGSSQIDYPLISNIPSGIVSSSAQVVDILVPLNQYTSSNDTRWSGLDAQSGSWVEAGITGSSLVTASFASQTLTFTKGDGTTFGIVIPDESGSVLPAGLVSGSSQIILQDTTGLLSGSRIDGVVANSTNSVYSQNTITTGKNLHTTTIQKGTPLFFTGSGTSGNLVGVLPADAGNPERMPAGGVAGESIVVGAEGVILLDGFINNVNTSLFPSGDKIYVGVGGGYTNVEPTGSAFIQFLGNIEKSATAGSGVIQMMGESRKLPNIPQGQAWVGDINGVPQAVSTASWDAHSDLTSLNAFTSSQEVLNATFATTGSNTFDGNQVIEGTNVSPAQTLLVKNGNSGIRFAVQNETLAGLTGIDVISNGNTQIGGELTVNDHSFIISSGSNTISFDPYIVSGNSAQVLFTAPNANFNSTGNFNIQVGGIAATDANRIDLNSNTINSNGNHTVAGTNSSPGQTFIAQNGSGVPKLVVNNALAGTATGADVVINGNTQAGGNLTFPAPGSIINITGGTVEAGEVATPLLLVDSLEPNTGTDIAIASGNLVFAGTGQVLNNENGAVIGGVVEGINEMASPLLLVDTIEPNTGTDIILNATNLTINAETTITGSARIKGSVNATTTGGHILEVLPTGGSGTDRGRIEVSDIGGGVSFFVAEATRTSFAATNAGAYADSLDFSYYNTNGSGTSERAQFSLGPDTDNTQNIIKLKAETIQLNGNTIVSGNLEMAPNTAIVGQTIDAQEMASPLLLVDSIEPNTGTDIAIASGNVTFAGTGQVLQNTNGAVVANSIEGITEMATPLLLVDTLEPNTGTSIDITGQQLGIVSQANNELSAINFNYENTNPSAIAGATFLIGSDNGNLLKSKIQAQASQMQFGTGGSNEAVAFGSATSTQALNFGVSGSSNALNVNPTRVQTNLNLEVNGNANIGFVMNLAQQDPLPAGNVGDLAVSGSNLFFYNGSWTQVV